MTTHKRIDSFAPRRAQSAVRGTIRWVGEQPRQPAVSHDTSKSIDGVRRRVSAAPRPAAASMQVVSQLTTSTPPQPEPIRRPHGTVNDVVIRRPGWANDMPVSRPAPLRQPSQPHYSRPAVTAKPLERSQRASTASTALAPQLPHPDLEPTTQHVATDDPVQGWQKKLSRKRRIASLLLEGVQYPFIAAAAVTAAYSSMIGQWFVLAYIVYAIVLRKKSKQTFVLALVMLLTVPLFQIIGQSNISENTAIYTYELLAFGTLQAIVELLLDERRHKKAAKAQEV